VSFPFIWSNIQAAHKYEVSQLIRYSRDCCFYHDFLDRGLLRTRICLESESGLFLIHGILFVTRVTKQVSHFCSIFICLCVVRCIIVLFIFLEATVFFVPSIYGFWLPLRHLQNFLIFGFATRVTRWVPHVKQALLTLPDHLNSSQILSGVCVARYFVFCVVFCIIVFPCQFSRGHCVVYPSIYCFWLSLWYLQTFLKAI